MKKSLPTERYYYSISEVADYFDITLPTLRHWEDSFDFLSPHKNAKGDRQYTSEDIEDVRLIYSLLKEQKFTIKGAIEHLKSNRKALTNRLTAINTLRGVRDELEKLKKSL